MHHAVRSGNVDLVRSLVDRGANLSIIDYFEKDTPVSYAFQHGPVELVKYFVEELGIDPMTIKEYDFTLLSQAVVGGNMDIIEYLLNRKGSTYDGNNLLEIAIHCSYLNIVKYLVEEKGVDVNFAKENGWTPLLYAVERDELDMVWCLIEMGANVNATDENSTTGLHIAAEYCSFDIVKCLIENGAKINVRDKKGNTPLRLAIQDSEFQNRRYKEDVKEYLISCGGHI